jgi:hypothetical protein
VRADCEVLVIPEAAMRRLVVADAELSELIMRAFILRRVALIEDIPHGVTMIGSHQTAATHRLRQFLTLNPQPGLSVVVLDANAPGGQAGPARASRTTSAFRPASPARRWPAAASSRRRSSAPRSPSGARCCGSTAIIRKASAWRSTPASG